MRKIKGWISTDKVGSTCYFEIEVEDDATEEEIHEEVWEAGCQYVDTGWEEVK